MILINNSVNICVSVICELCGSAGGVVAGEVNQIQNE